MFITPMPPTIKPTDEIEGMLAAQMVAAHNATMECYRRAMLPLFRARRPPPMG